MSNILFTFKISILVSVGNTITDKELLKFHSCSNFKLFSSSLAGAPNPGIFVEKLINLNFNQENQNNGEFCRDKFIYDKKYLTGNDTHALIAARKAMSVASVKTTNSVLLLRLRHQVVARGVVQEVV